MRTSKTLYEFVPLFITAAKVKMSVNTPRVEKVV